MNTAVLGSSLKRESGGGFVGAGGGWTATKWFLTDVQTEAEVYFNFNLDKRQGEFSEKDADYADDLVSILASALRDGPRPERTPENDPNLTLIGPAIGPARKLLSRRTSLNTFTSDSRYAVFHDKTRTLALSIETPDADPIEIAHFEYSPWKIHLVSDEMELLAEEGIPEQPGVKSSADPMRIWWVDHASKEKHLLRGPEKEIGLTEAPVSPDHRFVALDQYQTDPKDRSRHKVFHLIDRKAGSSVTVKLPKIDLALIGWRQTDAGLRAVGLTNRWGFDKDQPSHTYWIDPTTGNLELQPDAEAPTEPDLVSPDGKFRVQIGKDNLTVTNLESGEDRHFVFHEEDRPFVGEGCVHWVSPRYLQFIGPRMALIDAETLKMCFPTCADESRFPSAAFSFSPNFRWVLYQGEVTDEEGVFLAPVELPKD